MVKLLYCGVMPGFVQNVGNVMVNKEYEVTDKIADSLLQTRSWKRVNKVIKKNKTKIESNKEKIKDEKYSISNIEL